MIQLSNTRFKNRFPVTLQLLFFFFFHLFVHRVVNFFSHVFAMNKESEELVKLLSLQYKILYSTSPTSCEFVEVKP